MQIPGNDYVSVLKKPFSGSLAQLTACGMLLWALYPGNPYGYYVLLRIVCCACCLFLAMRAKKFNQDGWIWIMAVTAIVYNPILPIHLNRALWSVINVVTILILLASARENREVPSKNLKDQQSVKE